MEFKNRFYTFESEKNKYVYDNYTKQIYGVVDEVYNKIKENIFDPEMYSEKSRKDVINIFNEQEQKIPSYNENKCFITINASNKCNMNCSYCYRSPDINKHLTKNDLEEIVEFASKKYMPEATEYIFSFDFTSEPLLDVDLIKEFDEIIANNEGFLLKKEDFTGISEKELFESFPMEIQEKYNDEIAKKDFLNVINEILKNENLWNFWSEIKDEYIKKMITYSNKLSKQKSAMANRIIISEKFPESIKKAETKLYKLFFYSNGTLINQDTIDLLKGFNMNEFWISLDGPEHVNDYTRKYNDGKSTYSDVLNGIKLLQENNIKVNINSVITPKYIDVLELVEFFKTLNINTLNLKLVKNDKFGFTLESINEYFKKFDELLEKIFNETLKDDYSYIYLLKEHLFFKFLGNYHFRKFKTRRCNWGKKLSITADGNLYHCDFTAGLEEKIGTFKDNITFADIDDEKNVDDIEKCSNCFAKNFCGGTCYYTRIKSGNLIDEVECAYRKGMVERVFPFYVKLIECKKLEKVIEILIGKNEMDTSKKQNKKFFVNTEYIKEQLDFNNIEGWFSPLSRGVFDTLLDYQKKESIKGNCCEIGVWKGKSSVEIAKFLDKDEKLLLIDPLLDNNKKEIIDHISQIAGKESDSLEFISKYSEDYNYYSEGINYFNKTRFIHIDGCHVGESVYNDLSMADRYLCKNGIVVVDDFFNSDYPQITEAVYKYIFTNQYSFKIFLVGSNKVYLCRPNSYAFYNDFIMNKFQKEMLSRGIPITILKTAPIADTFAISFKQYNPSTDPSNGKRGFDWAPENIEYIANQK